MTAEEVLEQTFDLHKYRMAQGIYHQTEEAVLDAMKEYAKLKCQELLLLVAEKAEVKEYTFINNEILKYVNSRIRFNCGDKTYEINKDSILNAVDLDSFIEGTSHS